MSAQGGGGLLLFLGASFLVIALTYGASRLLGRWQSVQQQGRRLRVLEGVAVGKDRTLLLVAVGKEVLVVGSSANGVSLVHQVSDPEAAAEMLRASAPAQQESAAAPDFSQILTGLLPGALPSEPVNAEFQTAETAIRSNLGRMRALLAKAGVGRNA